MWNTFLNIKKYNLVNTEALDFVILYYPQFDFTYLLSIIRWKQIIPFGPVYL